MKVIFIHDRIITFWWAEKVFIDLIKENLNSNKEIETEYSIYTLFSTKDFLIINDNKIRINALIKNKFIIKKIWYRNLMPLFPFLNLLLSKKINKEKADKIIISSFAIWKNLNIKSPYKYLYLHSPMQYIWWSYNEYIWKFKWIKKTIYKLTSKYLRVWDKKFIEFNEIYFNSKYTKELAREVYWIDWDIKYPRISNSFLISKVSNEIQNYYVYVWRLVKFSKEVDKIIELFNSNNDSLLIIWSWPDEEYLKSISNWNIIFLWQIDNELEKIKIMKSSKWLINITKESFWIVTAESLSLWVPVFWFEWWATRELVSEKSWILVKNKELNNLIKEFNKFKKIDFNREEIKKEFLIKLEKMI